MFLNRFSVRYKLHHRRLQNGEGTKVGIIRNVLDLVGINLISIIELAIGAHIDVAFAMVGAWGVKILAKQKNELF